MSAFQDGRLVAAFALAPDDALLRGAAVFTTLRVAAGGPVWLEAHLARLRHDAAVMGLPAVDGRAGDWVCVASRALGDGRLRLTQTSHSGLLMNTGPLPARPAVLSAVCAPWPGAGLPAWVKHTSRLAGDRRRAEAGVDEVLWVDGGGCLLEGSWSTVFALEPDGGLWTPPTDGRILPGITRAAVLAAARREGRGVREAPLPLGWERPLAIGSSLLGLRPLATLDSRSLPQADWPELQR